MSKGDGQRTVEALSSPTCPGEAIRPQTRQRTTSRQTDTPDEVAALEAQVAEARRAQTVRRLRETLARIQRGEEEGVTEVLETPNSSQTLGTGQGSAPKGLPTFLDGMEAHFVLLALRYPAIHSEHFKNLALNKLEVQNICKLTTDFSMVKANKKYIRMGDVDLQIR